VEVYVHIRVERAGFTIGIEQDKVAPHRVIGEVQGYQGAAVVGWALIQETFTTDEGTILIYPLAVKAGMGDPVQILPPDDEVFVESRVVAYIYGHTAQLKGDQIVVVSGGDLNHLTG